MWRILPLVLLAGCDRLFGLHHLDSEAPPADAGADAVAPDSRAIEDAPIDALVQTHSNCPSGFSHPYENSLYTYVGTAMSWYEALAFCKSLDDPTSTKRVHLPVLTSGFERSNHIYVTVVGSASAFWVGLSDTAIEGKYQWVTDELVTYPGVSAWPPNEPSTGPDDDCVRVEYSSNDLDAMPCVTPSPFVCECDDHPYEPTHYALP